jgi:hypothetical protein
LYRCVGKLYGLLNVVAVKETWELRKAKVQLRKGRRRVF